MRSTGARWASHKSYKRTGLRRGLSNNHVPRHRRKQDRLAGLAWDTRALIWVTIACTVYLSIITLGVAMLAVYLAHVWPPTSP
jgi:Flp pilus assembly protein TadB